MLINVLAHEVEVAARGMPLSPEVLFRAVAAVHKRIRGSYAVVALIAGHGCSRSVTRSASARCASAKAKRPTAREMMVASESVAIVGTVTR